MKVLPNSGVRSARGSCAGPAAHTSEDGYSLGAWVNAQRTGYTAASSTRHAESAWRQCPVGPGRRDRRLGRGFHPLMRFVEREGHAQVPTGNREDGYRLGGWVPSSDRRTGRNACPSAGRGWRRCPAGPGMSAKPLGRKASRICSGLSSARATRGCEIHGARTAFRWEGGSESSDKRSRQGRLESHRTRAARSPSGMDVEHTGDSLGTWLCPSATVRQAGGPCARSGEASGGRLCARHLGR